MNSLNWKPPAQELPGPYSSFKLKGKRPVGQGGTSAVYRAESPHFDEVPIVIKFIVPRKEISVDKLRRDIRRELNLTRWLAAPSICQSYTLLDLTKFKEWAPFGLVLPYYGQNLRNFIDLLDPANGVSNPAEAPIGTIFKLLLQLCDALTVLHYRPHREELARNQFKPLASAEYQQLARGTGLIGNAHRDLRPENILLDLDPLKKDLGLHPDAYEDCRLLITDFGESSAFGEQVVQFRDDKYKDPDLLKIPGGYKATPREDMYAVGVIMEELANCTNTAHSELMELSLICRDKASRPTTGALKNHILIAMERLEAKSQAIIRYTNNPITRRQAFGTFAALWTIQSVAAMTYKQQVMIAPNDIPFEKTPQPFEGRSEFLDRFTSASMTSIDYGLTNQLRLAQGKSKGPSGYVTAAYTKFREAVASFRRLRREERDVMSRELRYTLGMPANVLLIGGPVSNPHIQVLNEYEKVIVSETGQYLPRFKSQGKLKFGFYCGTSDYGVWDDGKLHLAKRFENGSEVTCRIHGQEYLGRPMYSIARRDAHGITPLFDPKFLTNEDGFLARDFLLITVRPHPSFEDHHMISISGMHGYALEAFGNEIHKAIDCIDKLARSFSSFQLLVPAEVINESGPKKSTARLQWDWREIAKNDYFFPAENEEDWREWDFSGIQTHGTP